MLLLLWVQLIIKTLSRFLNQNQCVEQELWGPVAVICSPWGAHYPKGSNN